jgi:hypothetical protein
MVGGRAPGACLFLVSRFFFKRKRVPRTIKPTTASPPTTPPTIAPTGGELEPPELLLVLPPPAAVVVGDDEPLLDLVVVGKPKSEVSDTTSCVNVLPSFSPLNVVNASCGVEIDTLLQK